jgi:hypothetical protein
MELYYLACADVTELPRLDGPNGVKELDLARTGS